MRGRGLWRRSQQAFDPDHECRGERKGGGVSAGGRHQHGRPVEGGSTGKHLEVLAGCVRRDTHQAAEDRAPALGQKVGGGGDGYRPGHLHSYLHEVTGPQVPRLKALLSGPSTRPRRPSGEPSLICISAVLSPAARGKPCCHSFAGICSEIRRRGARLRRALLPGSCRRTWLWLAGQGGKKGLRGWCSDLTSPLSLKGRGRHLQGAPNLGRDVCCYWWEESLHGEERPGGQKTVVPNALWRLPRSRHTTGRQQGWQRAQGGQGNGTGAQVVPSGGSGLRRCWTTALGTCSRQGGTLLLSCDRAW